MSVLEVEVDDLATSFAKVLESNVEHFFVNADLSDPTAADEIVRLDVDSVESITRFLTLPTLAARAFAHNCDPCMDFSKSIILTSQQYNSEQLN